jgi:hypothetical protein
MTSKRLAQCSLSAIDDSSRETVLDFAFLYPGALKAKSENFSEQSVESCLCISGVDQFYLPIYMPGQVLNMLKIASLLYPTACFFADIAVALEEAQRVVGYLVVWLRVNFYKTC